MKNSKIQKLAKALRSFSPQPARAILAGEAIIKLDNKDLTFTSKKELLECIRSHSDQSVLMNNLKKWIITQLNTVSEKDLFSILNLLANYSLKEVFNALNYFLISFPNTSKAYYNDGSATGLDLLTTELADVRKDDKVLDPSSGINGAWLELLKNNPNQNMTVQELNEIDAEFAYLNTKILGATNCIVYQGDTLSDPKYTQDGNLQLFDKIVTFPPINARISKDAIIENRFNRFRYGDITYTKGESAFISNAISSLNQTGKAVIVVSDGPLFQGGKVASFRKFLVDHDLIETVIALPSSLLSYSIIPINILIINKNKTDSKGQIQFINANQNEWYQTDKHGKKILSTLGIQKIVELYHSRASVEGKSAIFANTDYKGTLGIKQYILPSEVQLDNSTYHINRSALQNLNTVQLQELVNIKRGYNVTRRNEDKKGHYLTAKVTDITTDHHINDSNLTRINIKTNAESYLIENNDILISTRGTIGKVAFVNNIKQCTVPNANLAILRVKSSKLNTVNMIWLMLYLASPLGQFMIQQVATGTAISTISTKDLGKIPIPVLPLEAQNKAVQQFQTVQAKLNAEKAALQKKIEANQEELYSSMNVTKVLRKENTEN